MSGINLAVGGARRGWRERWRARRSWDELCELPDWRGSLSRWTVVAWGVVRINLLSMAIGAALGSIALTWLFLNQDRYGPVMRGGMGMMVVIMILMPMLALAWVLLPRELRTPSRHSWLTRLFIRYDRWEAKLLNSRSQWSPENLALLDRVVGGWRGAAWCLGILALTALNTGLIVGFSPSLPFAMNWLVITYAAGVAILTLVNSWFSYLKYRDRLIRVVVVTFLLLGLNWFTDQHPVLASSIQVRDMVVPALRPFNSWGYLFYPVLLLTLVALIAFLRNREHDLQIARLNADAQRQRVAHQLTSSQLRMLQAQIEPHFLFNSLGTVQHLVDGKAPEAAALNASLIRFLRGSMQSLRADSTTLGDEKKLISAYLDIMKARMGERLDYAIDFPAELLAQPVPPTMLITLAENAIKHGLEPKPEGGRIEVKARIERGHLRLTVADNGRGFSDIAGAGVDLGNIRERLALRYGKRAALELEERENRGFVAHIVLPLAAGATATVEEIVLPMAA